MGKNELVPTQKLFGCMPSLPFARSRSPKQREIMCFPRTAREETAKIVAEGRITEPLRSKLFPVSRHVKPRGDIVRVYQEEEQMLSGPYLVPKVDGKLFKVIIDRKKKVFNTLQIQSEPKNRLTVDPEISVEFSPDFKLNQVESKENGGRQENASLRYLKQVIRDFSTQCYVMIFKES